jgi:hypothetical protein
VVGVWWQKFSSYFESMALAPYVYHWITDWRWDYNKLADLLQRKRLKRFK